MLLRGSRYNIGVSCVKNEKSVVFWQFLRYNKIREV